MSATPVEMAEAQDFPKSAFVVLLEDYRALERQLAEARAERDRFISALITMRKALVLNGSRLTDDAINAYEELKLAVTNEPAAAGTPDHGRPGTPHRSGGGHPVGPWPMLASHAPADIPRYKYPETFCSQCGGEFGPGNQGFSHCENHKHLPRIG